MSNPCESEEECIVYIAQWLNDHKEPEPSTDAWAVATVILLLGLFVLHVVRLWREYAREPRLGQEAYQLLQ